MRECWNEQIALPFSRHQKRKIYSFRNALLATGYDKIAITWQGMFYEISEADIQLGNMTRKNSPDDDACKWVTEGVTVFKWHPQFRHILRPHRFAMRTPNASSIDRKVFKPNKYYIHVYQTKIERAWKDLRTLHSRSIALHLNKHWGDRYWPRSVDIKLIQAERMNVGPRNRSFRSLPNHFSATSQMFGRDSTNRSTISSLTSKTGRLRRTFGRKRRNTSRESPRQARRTSALQDNYQPTQRVPLRRRQRTFRDTYRVDNRSTISRRSNDINNLANALQQISRAVNLLKSKIDL